MTGQRIHPEDFRIFVRVLLALWDWSQEQLAAAAGLSPSTITNYQSGRTLSGRTRHSRATVERLARAARVDLSVLDLFLLPGIAAWRVAGGRGQGDVITALVQQLRVELQGLVHLLLPLGQEERAEDRERRWPPAEVARTEALDLWKRLEDCEDADRWRLV